MEHAGHGTNYSLDDDGLLLDDDERALFVAARSDLGKMEAATLYRSLMALGRLRARHLERVATDPAPFDELRAGLRTALDRQVARVINEDDRLTLETTHALKDIAATYVTLGGDLELEQRVPAREYAAQAGELAQAAKERKALEVLADRLLDTLDPATADDAGHAASLIAASDAFETVRGRLHDLAEHRGRA